MKDIYDNEKENLDEFLEAFPTIEGQCGIIVGLGGKVSGLELLSSSDCYTDVHRQLIESYTMDCLSENYSGESLNLSLGEAQRFLEQICSATQETYPSKAAGKDVRLESEHIVGSGLVEGKELIHLSVFSRQSESQRFSPRMANYRHRRRDRQI